MDWFKQLIEESFHEAKNKASTPFDVNLVFGEILHKKIESNLHRFPKYAELLEFYSKGDGKVYDWEVIDSYYSPEVKGWVTGKRAKNAII